MSTSNLQKRPSENDSISQMTDADDSGFSELYHLLEQEETNWSSPRVAQDYPSCPETIYRPPNGPWSSSPNKPYTIAPFQQTRPVDFISKGYVERPPQILQLNKNYTVSDRDGLHYDSSKRIIQKRSPTPIQDISFPKQETNVRNCLLFSSEGQSTNMLNNTASSKGSLINRCIDDLYQARRCRIAPKVEKDIFDRTPTCSRSGTASTVANHFVFEGSKVSPPQYHPNIAGFTEYFVKSTPTAAASVPVFDLNSKPLNTMNQPLNKPRVFKSMTFALPELPKVKSTTNYKPGQLVHEATGLSVPTGQNPINISLFPPLMNKVSSRALYNAPTNVNVSNLNKMPCHSKVENSYSQSWTLSRPFENSIARPIQMNRNSCLTPFSSLESFTSIPDNRHMTNSHAFSMGITSTIPNRGTSFAVPALNGFDLQRIQQGQSNVSQNQTLISGGITSEQFFEKPLSKSPLSVPVFEDMSDDDTHLDKAIDVNNNNNKVVFSPSYSDISGEESPTETSMASDSSGDETTNTRPTYPVRKTKKYKRKSLKPRRSPDTRDPRFKGVTIWLQTEFKEGQSHLRLSAFYSNVKVGVVKPRYGLRRNSGVLASEPNSCSEAEGYSPPSSYRETYTSAKTCASCRTRRTPLWRDAEDGTPLCNACGIRYKKYRLRCSRCWYIPKKDIKTYPNCPACGSALRYSFHRKAW